MYGLGLIKFVVTRPIVLPISLVSGGLLYGSFDLSKKFGTFLMSTDNTNASETSRWAAFGIGSLTGVGTMSVRSFMSPYKAEQEAMWRDLSMSTLRTAQKLVMYNAGTLAISGIAAGLATAYALPKKSS
jgi:hypothetical protein